MIYPALGAMEGWAELILLIGALGFGLLAWLILRPGASRPLLMLGLVFAASSVRCLVWVLVHHSLLEASVLWTASVLEKVLLLAAVLAIWRIRPGHTQV